MVPAPDNTLIFFIFFIFFPIYKFDCYLDFYYYYYLIIDILFSFLTSFITTIGFKTAFYGLLSRFGFLVLSLYSFVFHFFQDDWINFCLIIDFLTFVFYDFQLKNCYVQTGETNLWSTCLRIEQVWFILRFSIFQIWLLFAF